MKEEQILLAQDQLLVAIAYQRKDLDVCWVNINSVEFVENPTRGQKDAWPYMDLKRLRLRRRQS